MKRFFFFLGVLGLSLMPIQAHVSASLTDHLLSAETVCLAKVTAIKGDKITFSVTEIFRGKNGPSMTLTALPEHKFSTDTEWLLIWENRYPGQTSVGWSTSNWLPFQIIRQDKEVYVLLTKPFSEYGIAPDKLPDGSQGLTLDHFKKLLATHPFKS